MGETLVWRIQLSSFEAVCRMVEAGVGIGVIPESAALRNSKTMKLAILELDEPWVVRDRSILIRDFDALPGCVKALISLLREQQ
ncbi:LysR substrate binding domain protein [compost metagenome]